MKWLDKATRAWDALVWIVATPWDWVVSKMERGGTLLVRRWQKRFDAQVVWQLREAAEAMGAEYVRRTMTETGEDEDE